MDRTIRALGGIRYGAAPEASEDVREWLQNHQMIPHFINGKFQSPGAGEYREVLNPADGSELARIAYGNKTDVEAALVAAKDAFYAWSGHSCQQRYEMLYALYRNLNKHARLFARMESMNNGKPIWQSRDLDIPLAIRHFRHHAGWAKVRDSRFPHHRPGGVVAQIIPWNFPLLMLAWKLGPALAAGNAVVLKPAETTPLTAMLFAELAQEVGMPKGVINILNGAGGTGKTLIDSMVEWRKRDPIFWKIAFTGSTEVGRAIRLATAGSGLRLSLELGGKSPFIIFDGADIKSAIRHLVHFAILLNYGQVCCAGSRLLVQESVAEQVIAEIKDEFRKLRGGLPMDKCMDLGAINSEKQRDTINTYIQCGREEGAEVWQPEGWTSPSCGFHCPPTLVTKVQPTSKLVREEIFGPVLTVMTFRTPKEAIELANNTVYGLAASVWTQDISIANQVARMVKAGVVWTNCTNQFDAASGFGGVKESGYGREGGEEGMEEYLVETHPVLSGVQTEVELLPFVGEMDQTYRHYINGKASRGDEGQSFRMRNACGDMLGTAADANRKDVRNAVAAARAAQPVWEFKSNPELRIAIPAYIAERLQKSRLRFMNSRNEVDARREFQAAVARLEHWSSMADKFGGRVQPVPARINVQAIREPIGVIGIRAPDNPPLLGLATLVGAAMAMGNSVVLVAGSRPFQAAEFIQILEGSCLDLPPGVINILTAKQPDKLFEHVAKHKDVDAVWCFADPWSCATVEKLSVSNMKRTWTVSKADFDWYGQEGESDKFLHEATQVKNIWTPWGV